MRQALGIGLGIASLVLLGGASVAQAQVYGPYTFDANSWVTSATQTGYCYAYPVGTTSCAANVVGHSPSVCGANIECAPGAYMELDFNNTTIVNNPGVDLVVFDTRFSTDAASIAVETAPGVWSTFDTWSVPEQFSIPGGTGCDGQTLAAVPVDLSRFNLPLGFTTKRIRVGGNSATGSCEFDLTMAGVPIGSPMCVTNADCNDGNPCTNDACNAGSCAYSPSGLPGCQVSVCGNGLIESGESCDDGNAMAGDGCSDTCILELGYECPTEGTHCSDIDECELGQDDCSDQATCINTPGSYMCECDPGYEGDGVTCTEIDECALGTDTCDVHATCTNTPGYYDCMCNLGYEGDGTTCTDIDECTTGAANCDTNATCVNMPGSFECLCKGGFVGDGVMCTTICGDGNVAGDEKCDDGNTKDQDGCSATCTIESGWTCGGGPSVCTSGKCGDGIFAPVEACDDGNTDDGDGCSSMCTVEPNWNCQGQPSDCVNTCPEGNCDQDPTDAGSCACSLPGQRDDSGLAALGAGLLALSFMHRRRGTKKVRRG